MLLHGSVGLVVGLVDAVALGVGFVLELEAFGHAVQETQFHEVALVRGRSCLDRAEFAKLKRTNIGTPL